MTPEVQIVFISTLGSVFVSAIPTLLLIFYHRSNKKKAKETSEKLDEIQASTSDTLTAANDKIVALGILNDRLQQIVDRLNAATDSTSRFGAKDRKEDVV